MKFLFFHIDFVALNMSLWSHQSVRIALSATFIVIYVNTNVNTVENDGEKLHLCSDRNHC